MCFTCELSHNFMPLRLTLLYASQQYKRYFVVCSYQSFTIIQAIPTAWSYATYLVLWAGMDWFAFTNMERCRLTSFSSYCTATLHIFWLRYQDGWYFWTSGRSVLDNPCLFHMKDISTKFLPASPCRHCHQTWCHWSPYIGLKSLFWTIDGQLSYLITYISLLWVLKTVILICGSGIGIGMRKHVRHRDSVHSH